MTEQAPAVGIELSIVLPAYNEAEGIGKVIDHLLVPVLQKLFAEPGSWEVIVVDDGSRDMTYDTIAALAVERPWLRGLRFSRNFGKEAAILAGLQNAQGKAILVMDSDGQHPPETLEQMWAIWKTGQFDVISGVKRDRSVDSWLHRALAEVFYGMMAKLTGFQMRGHSDFKLISREVVSHYLALPERSRFFRAMITWLGFRQADVPFVVAERVAGRTRWTMFGLLRLALVAITSFTGSPLYWVAYLGFFGMFLALVLGVQALYSRFAGIAVDGWTSLTLLLLFFGSAILLALGLIGVYLNQIFEEVKGRTPFIIAKDTQKPPSPPR